MIILEYTNPSKAWFRDRCGFAMDCAIARAGKIKLSLGQALRISRLG
jgi:hypothetical protein